MLTTGGLAGKGLFLEKARDMDVSNESESISMVRSVVDLLEILNRNNK